MGSCFALDAMYWKMSGISDGDMGCTGCTTQLLSIVVLCLEYSRISVSLLFEIEE